MKCKECVKQGLRSTIRVGPGASTCMAFMPYYDEDGVYHAHDPNRHTVWYQCSQGHNWTECVVTPCPAPACTYGKGSDQ